MLSPAPSSEGEGWGEGASLHEYAADLHIHTLLSPCAEIEMIPSLVVAAAVHAGLDMIGIADHNSCENAGAVIAASEGSGVKVLPGMEVQSLEGVHLLCLFDRIEQAVQLQAIVYRSLPSPSPGGEGGSEGAANELGAQSEHLEPVEGCAQDRWAKTYREQLIVDSQDEFLAYCQRQLSMPTSLGIDEIWRCVTDLGGIVIPAHIDRHATGLCDVLGIVPEYPDFAAVEVSRSMTQKQVREAYPSVSGRAILQNSDAHWLSAIGERRTVFRLAHRTVAEIEMACRSQSGRGLVYA